MPNRRRSHVPLHDELEETNTARKIGYWAATVLTALAFLSGGAMDLMRGPDVVAGMAHLGYPGYLATILGAWKIGGAIAILVPKFPRLKEWAYAGILFDLTGAAASHAFSGDGAGKVMTPIILLAIAAASWALRPATRTVAPALPAHEASTPERKLATA